MQFRDPKNGKAFGPLVVDLGTPCSVLSVRPLMDDEISYLRNIERSTRLLRGVGDERLCREEIARRSE